ncbi:DUF1499 domain-containing protein [Photobacterium sanctipauli]|uniref:DUF1499 domain-containing protein n=2 Tax=Photobacterium sanctipauli TaxID=1342794 RepID=A0A2T3NTK5_9GAMM|nr:DUF1499 domain-containing protein [Photobacterium sanctipauli]PSW19588.1 DUF1499 domain-containing protein [Photobacterium sanctipauli]
MTHFHYRYIGIALLSTALIGCSDSSSQANTDADSLSRYRIDQICGEKPNCVSTLDTREDHYLAPYELTQSNSTSWDKIKQLALTLPGVALAEEKEGYFRLESTSKVFKFVDDFEVKLLEQQLEVRSESRVGYSDFGVNRERAEQFRQRLEQADYIQKSE